MYRWLVGNGRLDDASHSGKTHAPGANWTLLTDIADVDDTTYMFVRCSYVLAMV